MNKLIQYLSIAITACCILAGCNSQDNNETALVSNLKSESFDNSKPLNINIALNETYCKKTACACVHEVASREYEELVARLKKEFNINLKIKYYVEPYHMEKEIKAKTFDGVICKPWSAFMFRESHKINFKRVADILDPDDNQWLKGVFMVKKDSHIKTLSDLNGKRLVAGQPDAYEKYHYPFNILKEKSIKPSKIINKASCLECINALLDDAADVAVVSDYVMSASCAVDIAAPEDFRIIYETGNTPLCSLILDMDKVSESDAMRLQSALLKLSGKQSPESMISKGFVKSSSWKPAVFKKN